MSKMGKKLIAAASDHAVITSDHIVISEIVWGAAEIAKVIGRTEKQTFNMMEQGKLPGAKKIAGRWAFKPSVFFAAFEDQ